VTIERARRFARAYLDEYGHLGEFEMSMPSELELEMVAAVLVKELDCEVRFNTGSSTIAVELPWKRFAVSPSIFAEKDLSAASLI